MKVLVLDKSMNFKELQIMHSNNIYQTLLSEGYDACYHTIRSIPDLEKIIKIIDFDKIFLCTLGDWGNNGTIQKVLDYYKLNYTFSDGKTSKLCYDKTLTKKWLESNNFSVPSTYTKEEAIFPCILKIVEGESSEGVVLINSIEELKKHSQKNYFLEEFLDKSWDEYTISLLETKDEFIIGNPIFIKKETPIYTKKGNEFAILDYSEKNKIRNLVVKDLLSATKKIGIKNACRIDFMIKNNKYKILEFNTMPIISPNSDFTRSLTDFDPNLTYINVIKQIIDL